MTKATEILYGGAAGGGKSHLMRAAFIIFCAEIPGLQAYLFRRKSKDLDKNHIEGPKGFRNLLAPWVDAKFVEIVEGEIRFWNGSKIFLCHCQHEKDRYNYQGPEIHLLGVDEATHFTEKIYRYLRTRVRCPGLVIPEKYKGMFPRIICGSNPGNVGHHFFKSQFIDFAPPLEIKRAAKRDGGMLRTFIPARLEDNPSMLEDDPEYEDRLEGAGSPQLVRALREGDWDVIEGAYFPEFTRERHTVRPFKIPKDWVRFTTMDWGSAAPFVVQWLAVSDGTMPGIPRDCLVMYREWYGGVDGVGLKFTAEQVALGIKNREADDEKITYRVCDPSMYKQDGGPSLGERFADCGIVLQKGDNDRLSGWDLVRSRLKGNEEGEPMLLIFDTCTDIIRTLPALQHDELKPEDVDSEGDDHAPDALRYGCKSRPWSRKPTTVQPFRDVTTLTLDELYKLEKQYNRQRRRA